MRGAALNIQYSIFNIHSLRPPSGRSAFTLLEVLAVVAIIAVLLGMLFPASRLVRESARRRLAQQQAQSIVQAIKQYRTVYAQWPGQTGDAEDLCSTNYAALIAALTNNPRNLVFLQDAESSIHGDCIMDPWNRPYLITVDENGNGVAQVDRTCFNSPIQTNVQDSVAVASWGPDPAVTGKWVYSWIPR